MADLKFILTINYVIAMFIAVLFPTEVGLADPLGLDEIREQNFANNAITNGLASYYDDGTFFDANGNPVKLDATLKGIGQVPAEGQQSVVTDEGFGFLDYPRIVLNIIISFIIFSFVPIILFFNMGYPLNLLFSSLYGGVMGLAIASYILGR